MNIQISHNIKIKQLFKLPSSIAIFNNYISINGRPELPDLNIPKEVEFNVYGAKDLQEEFKAFANMIAAGYSGYEYGM